MKTSMAAIGMAGIVLAVGLARGADLDNNADLTGDAVEIPLEGGSQNVAYKSTAPFGAVTGGYLFGDRNADGGNVAVTPPGLSMGAFYLRHNPGAVNSRSIRLDLNGGNLTSTSGYISTDSSETTGEVFLRNIGAIAMTNGYISTRSSNTQKDNNTHLAGAITITDVTGDIQMAKLLARGGDRGGAIRIESGGNVLIENGAGVAGLLANSREPTKDLFGRNNTIQVLHQGAFRAAGIASDNSWAGMPRGASGGPLVFDGAADGGAPSGTFQVTGDILARGIFAWQSATLYPYDASDVTIRGYTSVSVAGDLDTSSVALDSVTSISCGLGGHVTITNVTGDIQMANLLARGGSESIDKGERGGAIRIESGGNVLIEDGAGVPGLLANSREPTPGLYGRNNAIRVLHKGAFRAAGISSDNSWGGYTSGAGNPLVFDGAADGGAPSGSFQVTGDILARGMNTHSSIVYSHDASDVTIRGYTSVSVAGDILTRTEALPAISEGAAGDISITGITGNIMLGGAVDARSCATGNPTGNRGALTLQADGTITLGSLNLWALKSANFDAGGGVEIQEGIVGNDNTPLSGNGSTLSNAGNLTLQTGQTMIYRPEHNEALNGGTYTLSGGGKLTTLPSGTLLLIR